MKPVFKEEMNFLGINENLDGYLWVDSRCYYSFDKEFNKIKYGRDINKLPDSNKGLSTIKEVCENHYMTETKAKVELEKNKIKLFLEENKFDEIIMSVSGGKDSTVVEHMTSEICKQYYPTVTLFGNTSNETHFTYQYIRSMYPDAVWCNPKEGFHPWCHRNRFIPTRFGRACCSVFKEGNITEYLKDKESNKLLHICGIRRDESRLRSNYEQVRVGKWSPKAKENWKMYLPIIFFNDMDVWSYIFHFNLKFNKLYEFGYGRVGCTNCPFRSNYELKLNEHFLPTYDNQWKALLEDIFKKEGLAVILNCTLQEFLDGAWKAGVVRDVPTKEIIQEFANFKNIEIEDAEKYFLKNKCDCGKSLSKDVVALNMKLLGRNTKGRMCLKCLADFLETDTKSLKKQIEEFKQSGCNLF